MLCVLNKLQPSTNCTALGWQTRIMDSDAHFDKSPELNEILAPAGMSGREVDFRASLGR